MPYNAFEIMAPVVPGQMGMTPLACSVMALVAWQVLAPTVERGHGRSMRVVQAACVRLGQAATIVLLLVEVCVDVRGRRYLLDDWLVSFNTALIYVEAICAFLATVGWGLSCWCASEARRSDSPTRRLVAFFIGGSLPAAFMLFADLGGFWPSPLGAMLCLIFGFAAFASFRKLLSEGPCSLDEAVLLLAGVLSYQVSRALLGEIRAEGIFARVPLTDPMPLVPDKMAYAIHLALITVFSVALWLIIRRRGRLDAIDGSRQRPQDGSEKSVTVDIAPLASRAAKPLTEREVAVLEGTVRGESAEKIAQRLGLAKSTVATYRRRCCEKLGVCGVRELRDLAEELCDVGGEIDEVVEPVHDERSNGLDKSGFIRPIVILLLLMAGPFVHTFDNVQVGGRWLSRLSFVMFWLICLAVLFYALARLLFYKSLVCPRPFREEVSSIILTYTVSSSAFCFWWGSVWVAPLLFVMLPVYCLAFGGVIHLLGKSPSVLIKGMFGLLLRGTDRLLIADSRLPLLAFASLCLAQKLHLSVSYPLETLRLLIPALLVIASRVMFLKIYDSLIPKTLLTGRGEGRALSYLMGRGLGELQARVMLDLACGFQSREIRERRHVAASTIRSYRYRCFEKLDIHGIPELRKLLVNESGLTDFSKVQRSE